MKHINSILTFLIFISCSTKTALKSKAENEFSIEVISDSLMERIPTINYSKVELKKTDNQNIKNKYVAVSQKQLNFFYTIEEQKKLTDYFSDVHMYFYGKKKLGTEKLALFILNDEDYMGIYLDCVIVDKDGKLIGKFSPAYIILDSDYSDIVKGEFLNDSTYKYSEVNYSYIDSEHKKAALDSTIKIVKIDNKKILTKLVEKFSTDTILENNNIETKNY